jgi:hypothetical protein
MKPMARLRHWCIYTTQGSIKLPTTNVELSSGDDAEKTLFFCERGLQSNIYKYT